jgi:hypothetical protein
MSDLCPVCKGKRTVPLGFYSHDISQLITVKATETCRTCSGRGIFEALDTERIDDLYYKSINGPTRRRKKK